MKKHLYIFLLMVSTGFCFGQNNMGTGNAQASNAADNANAFITISNVNDNVMQSNIQQQQSLSNINPAILDNNIGIPQQAVESTPLNNAPSKDKSSTFDLSKPVYSGAGSSSSSGRHHSNTLSKKFHKINRRMNYVFSKKTKKSFHVDTCFAWAK